MSSKIWWQMSRIGTAIWKTNQSWLSICQSSNNPKIPSAQSSDEDASLPYRACWLKWDWHCYSRTRDSTPCCVGRSIHPSVQNIFELRADFCVTAPARPSATVVPCIWPCFYSFLVVVYEVYLQDFFWNTLALVIDLSQFLLSILIQHPLFRTLIRSLYQ